jgi:hypothetical protein
MIREIPKNIGDEDFAPQILNNSIVDDWTLTLRLMPPTLRNPESHILFLEVQASEKLQFRELVDVMYSGDPETPACSRARNKSTVSDLAIANALKNLDGEINMFGDIDNNTESAHVPGCLVSDRVRIRVNPQNSALPVVVNVTFPESIYEQGYFFRVSAVLSDSSVILEDQTPSGDQTPSVILQDQTYDNWGASSRSCQFAKEYLQTHRDNNVDWPFSSVEQLICRTCPLGASCSGEFVTFYDITARAGFRRLSWNHSVFGACPIAEACEGVKDVLDRNTGEVLGIGELSRGDKEFVEKCRSGHAQTSELCSDCIPKFLVRVTANPPGTCSKCPEGGTNMFMFVLLIFVALAYMGFLITDSLRGAKKMIIDDVPMPFHTIAIRIMSSYLQVAGMLMSFRVTLPRAVMDLVTVQRSASAVVEQTLSFDCTAGSRRGLELFFMKQTMAVAMPLMLPLVGCFWILANAWKRMRKQKLIDHINDKIGASIVVLYYLVFPAVVSRIAITFACTQYGDDGFEANKKFLMQRSLTTHCYSTSHTVHIATVTVPAIILYMLLVPGYLMYELHRLRKKGVLYSHDKHYEPGWTYRFGFLFAGYEPKYAHWEIVVLVRKAAFVLVTVFTRPAGMAAQVMSAVLVLILSLSAHIHFSPYDHDSHDALESASLHANLITLPVALLANEMSIVYGTGTIGEGGQQILGPAESALFTVTAFSTFGFFVYLFFHGILMEKVDDPGLLGKMSRFVCKCWHKKDEAGRVLRVKSTRSKSVRRKTITRMASVHGDASRAHLVAMGLDPDEVNDEFNRLQKEKRLNKQFVSGVDGEGGIGAAGVARRVKVRPLLPTQREKGSNSTMAQNGGKTALVAGTMGSAYLDLLPNGVKKPRGATMRGIESRGELGHIAEVEKEGKAGADIVVRKPPSAVQLDVSQTVLSNSTTTSSPLNKPVTLAGPVTALASPAKPEKTPWLQPGYIETLTLKELKKAYKTAKAESNDLAYVEYKARYAHAKAIDRGESGRAKLVATSLNADGDESAAGGTDGDERAAAAAAGFARRLSRTRNKLKAVGGLGNKKRQSQSIVM